MSSYLKIKEGVIVVGTRVFHKSPIEF